MLFQCYLARQTCGTPQRRIVSFYFGAILLKTDPFFVIVSCPKKLVRQTKHYTEETKRTIPESPEQIRQGTQTQDRNTTNNKIPGLSYKKRN